MYRGSRRRFTRNGSGNYSILEVQLEQQVFLLKRLIIGKLHSNKTTPTGLGRIDCSFLRISSD
jgi:hypothetical protein